MTAAMRRLWQAFLDVLFPPAERCLLCGRSGAESICSRCQTEIAHPAGLLCPRCGRALGAATDERPANACRLCAGKRWAFSQARSIGPYDGALRRAIHRLKFGGRQDYGRALADLLGRTADSSWRQAVDCLVPVPLHPQRQRQRGFNQAEVIADQLSLRWNKPVRRLLLRTVATSPQTGLSQQRRRQNVQTAFALAPGGERLARGQRLLVVDDVMTTGSTLDACARVLCQAGAAEVRAVTLAVTNLRGGAAAGKR